MILGLRTAIYSVPADRLAEARDWYARAAGKPPYFDQPFYVGFEVGGFELGLRPTGQNGPGGAVGYWGTADAEAEVARLVGLGATVVEAVKDVGEGIKVAVVADPFGNLVGVIENPHFNPQAVR
jgi:predicted enzyme related to lactoylglutathione lyase